MYLAKRIIYKRFFQNLFLLILFFCSSLQTSKASTTDEFSNNAHSFSLRHDYYSCDELIKEFKNVLHSDLVDDFNKGWIAIYKAYDNKEISRLSSTKEISHIQCLYETLSNLRKKQEGDWLYSQKVNVYSIFLASIAHKQAINKYCNELGKKVENFL